MKFLHLLPAMVLASVVSFQASAGSAIIYESSSAASVKFDLYPGIVMTNSMVDQVRNGGCIPRGILIPDSVITTRFQLFHGVIPKGTDYRVRFSVCDDPLALSLPNSTRLQYGVTGVTNALEGKLSDRNNLRVSLTTPSGGEAPFIVIVKKMPQGMTFSKYETIGVANTKYGTAERYIDATEAGTYELVISNPTSQNMETTLDLTIQGEIVP